MIDVQSLSKRFGDVLAVDSVSFKVERGEVVGFLGPNGAGKSTTMKMVTGFLSPTVGTAFICGHDVRADRRAVQRHVGYLPEGAPAYGDMSVGAFLDFVARMRGLKPTVRRERTGAMVHQLALAEVYGRRIETLSKGFQRRVGIAQALVHDPDVLVLDEPTDGLDPNQKHEMRTLIRSIAAEKAIVVSTHILEEVEAICTRAIVITRGRLVADAAPDELLAYMGPTAAIQVAVDFDDHERAFQAMTELDSVARVELAEGDAGLANLIVHGHGRAPDLAAVGARLHAADVFVADMRLYRPRLDDVFRQITSDQVEAGD